MFDSLMSISFSCFLYCQSIDWIADLIGNIDMCFHKMLSENNIVIHLVLNYDSDVQWSQIIIYDEHFHTLFLSIQPFIELSAYHVVQTQNVFS